MRESLVIGYEIDDVRVCLCTTNVGGGSGGDSPQINGGGQGACGLPARIKNKQNPSQKQQFI